MYRCCKLQTRWQISPCRAFGKHIFVWNVRKGHSKHLNQGPWSVHLPKIQAQSQWLVMCLPGVCLGKHLVLMPLPFTWEVEDTTDGGGERWNAAIGRLVHRLNITWGAGSIDTHEFHLMLWPGTFSASVLCGVDTIRARFEVQYDSKLIHCMLENTNVQPKRRYTNTNSTSHTWHVIPILKVRSVYSPWNCDICRVQFPNPESTEIYTAYICSHAALMALCRACCENRGFFSIINRLRACTCIFAYI